MNQAQRTTVSARPLSEGAETAPVSLSNSAAAIAAWCRELERAPRSVLMLDYDGTLAPFMRERMQARMYPGVVERLLRLAADPRTRLVLVSGRPVGDFHLLLPPDLRLEIWGSHGRENRTADGRYTMTPLGPAQQRGLDQLETELHRRALTFALERKVGSLAVHVRGLADPDAERVATVVRDFYATLITQQRGDGGLELLPFDGGLELRGTGCSKATAVATVLGEEAPGTPAAYLGDDLTDEDAFVALGASSPGRPRLRVLVRAQPRPSAADLWLVPPEELLAFLDQVHAAVSGPVAQPEQTS